jgi:hypothetical protein
LWELVLKQLALCYLFIWSFLVTLISGTLILLKWRITGRWTSLLRSSIYYA